MSLEARELRSFLILAEQLHFGRSANLLHISQPALSKQMKGMEQKIGGPLLVRNRRDVRHEPEGLVDPSSRNSHIRPSHGTAWIPGA